MSSALQHTIIRASAGTGKTYQLANRYIALLLLQRMATGKIEPDKIVAMTFTRKGAGEFAERILHRLAAAAGDAQERRKLQADLALLIEGDAKQGIHGLAPGVNIAVDEAMLQSALAAMIDQFDRLVLGTIDGFMARSVQTLAFELGIGGFEILETGPLQRERELLLGEVFRSVPTEDIEVFYQTLKLATLKSGSGLRSTLDGFVESCHKLVHAIPGAESWGGELFWGGAVPSPVAGFDWKAEASSLAVEIAAHDFGHKNVSKSLASALTWIAERSPGSAGTPPSWVKESGLLAEVWGRWPSGDWVFEYYKKDRTIPTSVMTQLRSILTAWVAAEGAAFANKTAAIHGIVARYEVLYETRDRRKGRLAFGDLPLLLDEHHGSAATREALHLLAYRWYQKFDHWLLDEFQDTSRTQWNVLKPWVDDAIQDDSGTKSVFVVGDAKQSIYGWRGGEPRLFGELATSYRPGMFNEQNMAKSWRSRPAVLDLVNRVCDPARNSALSDPERFSSAAKKRWLYDHHEPEDARRSAPGYAAVLLAKQEDAENYEAAAEEAGEGGELNDKMSAQGAVIKTVLETVKPLERGLSCAILVRKGGNAKAIAQWLRAHGVPQVMVEGDVALAEQAPVVAALVDALRWLATPAHSLGAGHIGLTPLWSVLTQAVDIASAGRVSESEVWRYWRSLIAEIGAPQVTHQWCAKLATAHGEQSYTRYCLNYVSQVAQQAGVAMALADWLGELEQLTVRETAAAGSIHVMTIHKAKGLGFDVVFLPDLDCGGGGSDKVLLRRDERGVAVGCLAYPPKWLQAWDRTLGALCAAQKAEQDLEALCVLYVALTRAKEATFVILKEKKPPRAASAREWILAGISNSESTGSAKESEAATLAPWGEHAVQWEGGVRDYVAGGIPAQVEAPAPLSLLAPVPRPKRSKPSDAGHARPAQAATGLISQEALAFGTAVHKVFEQIEWWVPEQALVGDEAVVALVRRCMGAPEIQKLFSPEAGRDEALRELPVEFMEHDSWWSGVLDRLLLRRNADGSLREALVIDFKTDRVDSVEILRERYSEQLGLYRRMISTALGLREDQVSMILLSTCLQKLLHL
jgi:ATP-dependent exoDNAse (exonuclease V) beta subunit